MCQDCNVQYNAGYDKGKQDGYTQGQASCPPDRYNNGFDAGRQQGITQGQNQCKDNPTICGLKTQSDVDDAEAKGIKEGKLQGKEQCQKDPTSCGLKTQSDVDVADAEKAAKKTCLENLETCVISNVNEQDVTNTVITNIQSYCLKKPEICGLKTQADVNEAKKQEYRKEKMNAKTTLLLVLTSQWFLLHSLQTCVRIKMKIVLVLLNQLNFFFPKIKMERTTEDSSTKDIDLVEDFEMYLFPFSSLGKWASTEIR
jgi:hypothetical protein